MKIALTYNLKPASAAGEHAASDDTYAEWDEPDTIAAVHEALAGEHEVILLEDDAEIESRLLAVQPDMVFNLNPLPGILPHAESHSCFPQAAAAAGIAYPDLIRQVLHLACQRYGLRD